MNADKDSENFADDLLVKYLLKEANTEEKVLAEQWINASAEHQKHFKQLSGVWDLSHTLQTDSPSAQDAWTRFQQRVQQSAKTSPKPVLSIKKWMAAAAILAIVVSGSWLWYRHASLPHGLLTISSGATPLTYTLKDNTIVTLNKNSTISYPSQFDKNNRSVQLQGEAFFEVKQDKSHPFIVHVNDITVTVLGTSFNINEKRSETEIIVKSGRIKVTGSKNSVQLQEGEKVIISSKTDLLKKEMADNELYSYYRTQEFVCNNTPLNELVATLNEAYDAHIKIANVQTNQLLITTTFHRSQPLDTILSIITQTLPQVTYTKEGNEIILK